MPTSTPFSSLELHSSLLNALQEAGFHNCTPIQEQALPLLLSGQGVAGQAQTGTGKTAAYLLASLQLLLSSPDLRSESKTNPNVLIVAPTRELAIQIHKDALLLSQGTDVRTCLVYGGTDLDKQRNNLADGMDILIGTPGRLIDFLRQGVYQLGHVRAVVLDEADRMFDLGFISDIRYLLRRTPPPSQRLNMLFSATLSHRVLELAYEHMGEPKRIEVNPDQVAAERVRQILYHVSKDEKHSLLLGLLKNSGSSRSIVFINTRRMVERVCDILCANGIKAVMISGDVRQEKRERVLGEFKRGETDVLVTTDVAARGLHVPGISHVYNYDLPQNAEDYVHRIGRTARAGESGDAVSMACEEFVFSLPEIEAFIGQRIPVSQISEDLLCKDFKVPPKRPMRNTAASREGAKGRSGGSGRGRPPPKREPHRSREGGKQTSRSRS
ncbi:MAG: DEAD/DEAH box helicase [Candidatus Eutrophobiaceae bacterium]